MDIRSLFNESKTRLHLRTILYLAQQLEIRAEAMYGALAEKVIDPEIRDVCKFLANEEQRHAKNLAVILDQWNSIPQSEKDPRTFAFEAEKITAAFFSEMPPVSDPVQLLHFALGQENKSIQMYEYFQERLNTEFTQVHKKYGARDEAKLEWKLSKLDDMIEEEQRHKKIIADLINKKSA